MTQTATKKKPPLIKVRSFACDNTWEEEDCAFIIKKIPAEHLERAATKLERHPFLTNVRVQEGLLYAGFLRKDLFGLALFLTVKLTYRLT